MTTLSINPQDTWALLIGVGKFTDKDLPAIPAVTNNLAKLRELLANPTIIGIPPEQIIVIGDKEVPKDNSDILGQIKKLPFPVETLFVYYVGHGISYNGPDESCKKLLYLAHFKTPHDSSSMALPFVDLWNETFVRATNLIYILDCCYSGKALDTVKCVKNKNTSVLTATWTNEKSRAPKGELYTAFTKHLLELLENGFGTEPTLTTTEIRKELKRRLPNAELPKPSGEDRLGTETEEPLRIAYNRAYSRTGEKSNWSPKKCKGSLLPYLMNRQRQKLKLISALQQYQANQGPLLCFIHSDDGQSSDTCLTRLREDWIPKDKTGKSGVRFCKFDCNVNNLNDLSRNIWIDLGDKLLDNNCAKPQEIVENIAKEPGPVILYTDLYTENWVNCGQQELINAFIKFWADWKSSSAQRQLLLVCLVFHYKKDYEQVSWLGHLWRRKPVNHNQSIRDFFQELEKTDYLNNSSVNYVILPELQDISVEETEEWARDCLQECCHLLVPKIRELVFVPTTKGKLPMDQLVDKLKPILQELREPCNVRV